MNFDYVERDYSDKTAELFLAMGIMMLISGALCTLLVILQQTMFSIPVSCKRHLPFFQGIFTIFGAKQLSASLLRLSLVLQGLLMVSVAIFVCLGIALIWMTGSPWGLLLLLVLIPYLGKFGDGFLLLNCK